MGLSHDLDALSFAGRETSSLARRHNFQGGVLMEAATARYFRLRLQDSKWLRLSDAIL